MLNGPCLLFLSRFFAEVSLVLRSSCGVGAGGRGVAPCCFLSEFCSRFKALASRGVIGGGTGGVLGGGIVREACSVLFVASVVGECFQCSATSCGMTPYVGEYVNHPSGFGLFGTRSTSSRKNHSHPLPSFNSAHTNELSLLMSRTVPRRLLGVPVVLIKISTPGYNNMF